jgi:DNA-binding response OmpR family regulator
VLGTDLTIAYWTRANDHHNRRKVQHPLKKIVLVVDDDKSLLENSRLCLEMQGYMAITADCVIEGLVAAISVDPDVIIIDYRMPVMSGVQLLRLLRTHAVTADTKVVIMTGDYFLSDVDLAYIADLGAEVCYKPLFPGTLEKLVSSLIGPPSPVGETSDAVGS